MAEHNQSLSVEHVSADPPSTSSSAYQLAYLGMGNMGRAMAKNLVLKGNLEKPLILYNRTLSRTKSVSERIGHSIVAETVTDAVAPADIIFSCLMDSDAVNDTFHTILQGDVSGKLFVECSTISPELTDELAVKLQAAGAEFVAMPVFGEPAMAENGNLTCVLAGPAHAVDRVKPYLVGVIGRAIIDLSDSKPSTSTLLKNIGNIFIVGMIETVAEGHVLAEKTGLSAENLQKFIAAVLPGPYMIYSKRMSSGDYYMKEPPVALSMAQHLASEILEMGEKNGASLNSYRVAYEHMKLAREHFGSEGDISGIYAAVRLESGLSLRNRERIGATEA